ncbi:MAG TPA: contractile injection system protein, VgrG/Pvc8 family, partial [Pyrinomonadaceae bacterium]|nr:contractile injection system protein, VgrG/Pvc8 family [Pyrinomonadaceae bacterium]
MAQYTQDHRMIQVATPLGKDVLLLQGFRGHEGVSELFRFELSMHSENRAIALDSLVGKQVTVNVIHDNGRQRYINGVVSSFSQGGSSPNFAYYHATVVPWLWLLTRASDCRIFQNMSV